MTNELREIEIIMVGGANDLDYFKDISILFQLIEERKWNDVISRCESNESEASHWVVKKDEDCDMLIWRRLPLHEAIVRRAPKNVISSLIAAFPDGVRESDMNGRLALHLACAHGMPKEILELLLMAYPESLEAKDEWGKTAISIAQASCSDNYSAALEAINKKPAYYAVRALEEKQKSREEKLNAIHKENIQSMQEKFNEDLAELKNMLKEKEREYTHMQEQYNVATSKIKALEESEVVLKRLFDKEKVNNSKREGENSSIQKKIALLEAKTEDDSKIISVLRESEASLKSALEEQRAKYTELTEWRENKEGFEKKMKNVLSSHKCVVTTLAREVEKQKKRFGEVEGQKQSSQKKITMLESRAKTLEETISSLRDSEATLTQEIEDHKLKYLKLYASQSSARVKISSLEAKINEDKKKIETLQESEASLKELLSKERSKTKELTSSQDSDHILKETTEPMQARIHDLEAEYEEAVNRILSLEKGLETEVRMRVDAEKLLKESEEKLNMMRTKLVFARGRETPEAMANALRMLSEIAELDDQCNHSRLEKSKGSRDDELDCSELLRSDHLTPEKKPHDRKELEISCNTPLSEKKSPYTKACASTTSRKHSNEKMRMPKNIDEEEYCKENDNSSNKKADDDFKSAMLRYSYFKIRSKVNKKEKLQAKMISQIADEQL